MEKTLRISHAEEREESLDSVSSPKIPIKGPYKDKEFYRSNSIKVAFAA